jgi:hypothetical protein
MTINMAAALTWTKKGDRISLVGRIDENADLAALAAAIPPEGATLDLGGVGRINSIGVREWMDFIGGLSSRKLRLARCAPVFVDQLNAISNFAGNAELLSVLASFECANEGEVTDVEVSIADARKQLFPTPPTCKKCGATMIAAQEDALYYRFLRYLK